MVGGWVLPKEQEGMLQEGYFPVSIQITIYCL
jgi:hypothetical protein